MKRGGEIAWCLVLGGLPFAPFLDRRLDLWHAQTLWVHLGLIVLIACTLGSARFVPPPNRPLAAWFCWVSLWVFHAWTAGVLQKQYPVPLLMPWLHCLSVVLFYWTATSLWTAETLERLLKIMAYAGMLIMGYALLQAMNLDQFFTNLDTKDHRDVVVGTIGNPSHLGAYLALLLPLLLFQRGIVWRIATGVCLGLLGLLALWYASISGTVAAIAVLLWWAGQTHRKWCLPLLGAALLLGSVGLWQHRLWNPEGRLMAWTFFWALFQKAPITGLGPGTVFELSTHITQGPMYGWRHVHNEYLQLAIEQGVIGLGCLLWAVWDCGYRWRQLKRSPLTVTLGGMGIAFLLLSGVTFPAHLWLLASMGLVAYCGIYVLSVEEM